MACIDMHWLELAGAETDSSLQHKLPQPDSMPVLKLA